MAFFEAENISISFGGIRALNRVSFDVHEGEIFSIIGPNGAGKTTVFNCINRFYDLDQGSFCLENHDLSRIKPHAVADMGIARTFQNIELFKNMTVLDNLILGRHCRRRTNFLKETFFVRAVRDQEIESREKTEEIIDFLDLEAYREQLVLNLPYGVQKTVELGRALAMDPRLLLLDEPSSGLNVEETDDLSFWMSDIKEELGITILLVEHNVGFVQQISDRVLALNFGEVITHGSPKEVLSHPEVMKAYLGEEDDAS
ncbi:MAG: ABC transporter ATP-binding protein [Desulfatiglans sp.]|jgi:branched-chain amino acid transport system ATP-binding protein|nr:ABC transporter ATP-binding protein [Thermodesulfobacteriota bacterium]MEE4352826.1 ABC transporter ATP-binding protein [Desulfatiglans sp.]